MLAPLRDYLRLKNPSSSTLLAIAKDQYFDRLCVWKNGRGVDGFTEVEWFVSEDINTEHLLDVFVSIDTEPADVWGACYQFLDHLAEYKPRPVILGPKIDTLPETHPSKAECVRALAILFAALGDFSMARRLHLHELRLWQRHGNELNGAIALTRVADANRLLGNTQEGIGQAEEALRVFERLEEKCWQGHCLKIIAWGYVDCRQLRGASRCIDHMFALLRNGGDKGLLRSCGRILATISVQMGNLSDAKEILESTLEVPLLLGDAHSRFWITYRLVEVYFGLGDLNGVCDQITSMKSLAQASHDQYLLGRAMELQAKVWLKTGRVAEARSEVLLALAAYGKAGNSRNQEKCGELLKCIEMESNDSASKMELKNDGEGCDARHLLLLTMHRGTERVSSGATSVQRPLGQLTSEDSYPHASSIRIRSTGFIFSTPFYGLTCFLLCSLVYLFLPLPRCRAFFDICTRSLPVGDPCSLGRRRHYSDTMLEQRPKAAA